MLSVILLLVLLTAYALVNAWSWAFAARLAGSRRGRLLWGLAAYFAALGWAVLLLPTYHRINSLLVSSDLSEAAKNAIADSVSMGGFVAVPYLMMRQMFRTSWVRTLAPLAAYGVVAVATFAFVTWVLRPYVIEAMELSAPSMAPTIQPRDYVCVLKFVRPRRWDIVVYWAQMPGVARGRWVKRLVGLPGERIRFSGGQLYVNDQFVNMPAAVAGRYHASPDNMPPQLQRYHDGQSIALGPGEYFFIGDNTGVSADSRITGPSDASAIIGVVDLIYWPLPRLEILR